MKGIPVTTRDLELGAGVYSFTEAAKIVGRGGGGASPRQLHHWITTGLTPLPDRSYGLVLTFEDLMSLELVSRFRRCAVSLQRIRRFEAQLRSEFPALDRPFSNNIFFTDGVRIWAKVGDDDPQRAIELVGRHTNHYVWTEVISSFAEQVEYGLDGRAEAWQVTKWVEIRPSVQFGRPVVRGTRLPAQTVMANLAAGSIQDVADWYGLTVEQVKDVQGYFARAA